MIYPGPLINRPPCQLRLTSPPPPQTLPHIPTIPIHPHWFPQLVHMQHTGSWHESCMTCCSFFMSGCSRQGKPNAKLGSVRPVFPPPDRMKFFWAVKSSKILVKHKKINFQAWLVLYKNIKAPCYINRLDFVVQNSTTPDGIGLRGRCKKDE